MIPIPKECISNLQTGHTPYKNNVLFKVDVISLRQINEEAQSDSYVIYNSTIIARSGYNHGSYITGPLPERLKRMDIPTHIKQRRTIRETSKCIAAFVVSALNKPQRHVDRARLLLKAAYEESKRLVQV